MRNEGDMSTRSLNIAECTREVGKHWTCHQHGLQIFQLCGQPGLLCEPCGQLCILENQVVVFCLFFFFYQETTIQCNVGKSQCVCSALNLKCKMAPSKAEEKQCMVPPHAHKANHPTMKPKFLNLANPV